MKSIIKRCLALLMLLTLVAGMFSGCSKEPQGPVSGDNSVGNDSAMPSSRSGMARLEPMLVMGMIAARSCIGL